MPTNRLNLSNEKKNQLSEIIHYLIIDKDMDSGPETDAKPKKDD